MHAGTQAGQALGAAAFDVDLLGQPAIDGLDRLAEVDLEPGHARAALLVRQAHGHGRRQPVPDAVGDRRQAAEPAVVARALGQLREERGMIAPQQPRKARASSSPASSATSVMAVIWLSLQRERGSGRSCGATTRIRTACGVLARSTAPAQPLSAVTRPRSAPGHRVRRARVAGRQAR